MSGAAHQMTLPLGRGLDIQRRLAAALARALKGCGLSREQIADRINEILDSEGNTYRASAAMLDRWAAPSDHSHNLPAWLVPTLCRVTNSRELVAIQAEALGLAVVGEREQHLITLAEAELQGKRLAKRKRQALEALEEMKS